MILFNPTGVREVEVLGIEEQTSLSGTLLRRIYIFLVLWIVTHLFTSCGRLENTIPACEPHIGRDLHIRSPDIHNQ